jgi:diguanylate cyclase (GGDEF)-like protein
MTLYRQLLLSTFLILFCQCTSLWIGELKYTRDFLVNQMETHDQDTATSLGLTLSAIAQGTDIPAMETTINALFDRGYYRFIELRDIDGKTLVKRSYELTQEQVPSWFIRLVPLSVPQASALVMHGWQQTGTVAVESHPGYAYQALWDAAKTTTLWFSLTGAIIALLGGIGLRVLLSPLRRVEEQALALGDRQFLILDNLPRTRELRQVVTTMNQMTLKIRDLFIEQTSLADTLRQQVYQDPLTGIGNRRYLDEQIKAKLEGRDTEVKGAFLLFQVQDLLSINQTSGYKKGDEIIKNTAAIIQQVCHQLPEAILARLGGGDFALLIPNTDEQTTKWIADSILEDVHQQTATDPSWEREIIVCGGGVHYDRTASLSELLAKADNALTTARYKSDRKLELVPLIEAEKSISTGKTEWKDLLGGIIARRSIVFYSQPTVNLQDRDSTMHHEILARVIDDAGRYLSMGMFVPIAERLSLTSALDKMIIEKLLEQPLQQLSPARIAINMSPLSLTDEEFVKWIYQRLEQCSEAGLQLNFEFPEFRIIRYSNLIKEFSKVIKRHGHALGIDHFGQGLMHFGYLKSLLPDYVKIDRAITNELLDDQNDRYFFIKTLCNVAHSLDIKVIIEAVENESQWKALARMPFDGAQGFYIQQPTPITT